ncbi:MAG: hypothetical protein U0556_10800 [Dehalococcoidia bacterium]
MIDDFEGEFQRPISERRIKRSPLRDVCGVLASLHNISYAALRDVHDQRGLFKAAGAFEPLARFTHYWLQAAFYEEYLDGRSTNGLHRAIRRPLQILLDTFLLERSMTDLRNTLRNRPGLA